MLSPQGMSFSLLPALGNQAWTDHYDWVSQFSDHDVNTFFFSQTVSFFFFPFCFSLFLYKTDYGA